MLFFIRLIFWLSVVAYFLPWPEDPIASLLEKSQVQSTAKHILDRAAEMAQAAAERECFGKPEACLKSAARLGRMAAQSPAPGKDSAPLPVDARLPRN